ncbi:MAG: DUF262 domain-containing protein [Methanophagales archaeon]|nr:DUF262 domain-containing protein [Methanophagales archaeon]
MKDGIYHLSDLFEGNRIFSIPDYQRNYAWEDKHLEDFVMAILIGNTPYTYIKLPVPTSM